MGVQVNPYLSGTGPFPPFKRAMVFIDGENLVCRYQAMADAGRTPISGVQHKKDVYVWAPNSIQIEGLYEIERATMYTYTNGDVNEVAKVSDEIQGLKYGPHLGSQLSNRLFPKVFSKRKGAKGKGVDIQMSVDILTHAHNDNFDILYLVAGDGDYHPLLEQVMRLGKQVYVAALSSGLSPKLQHVADAFVNLDQKYFSACSNA